MAVYAVSARRPLQQLIAVTIRLFGIWQGQIINSGSTEGRPMALVLRFKFLVQILERHCHEDADPAQQLVRRIEFSKRNS